MGKFLCSLWKNWGNLHVKAPKMHFLSGHRAGGGGHLMNNVVEGKWGTMEKNGGKCENFFIFCRAMEVICCQSFNASAFVVVGVGIIPSPWSSPWMKCETHRTAVMLQYNGSLQ